MQTIAKTQPIPQPPTEEAEPVFNWATVKFEEWETPQIELNLCPEYIHLQKLCKELGLSL